MNSYFDALQKLKESILSNDFLIFLTGIVALVFMLVTLVLSKAIKNRAKEWKKIKI